LVYVQQKRRQIFNISDLRGKCSSGWSRVAKVHQDGPAWQMFTRRDVGGKCSKEERLWQMCRMTFVADAQHEGRL